MRRRRNGRRIQDLLGRRNFTRVWRKQLWRDHLHPQQLPFSQSPLHHLHLLPTMQLHEPADSILKFIIHLLLVGNQSSLSPLLLDLALAQLDHLLALYAPQPLPPSQPVVEPVFSQSTLSAITQLLLSSSQLLQLANLSLPIPLSPPPLLSHLGNPSRNQRNQRNLLVLLLTFDQSAKPPKDSTPTRSISSLEYLESVNTRTS